MNINLEVVVTSLIKMLINNTHENEGKSIMEQELDMFGIPFSLHKVNTIN